MIARPCTTTWAAALFMPRQAYRQSVRPGWAALAFRLLGRGGLAGSDVRGGEQASAQIVRQDFLHGQYEAAARLVGGEQLDARVGGIALADEHDDFQMLVLDASEAF